MKCPDAARCKPRERVCSVVGRPRDLDVLESLAWAGILTTSQVARLHFPSRRTAERRLRALLDHGLVRSCLQNEHLHRDSVHLLTPRGAEHLAEERKLNQKTVRPGRVPRPQKLRHALAVRDVFVEFVLAGRMGAFELQDFAFDDDLARLPAFKERHIVPDGLSLVRAGGRALAITIEVDLGSETTTTLRKKFENHRAIKTVPVAGVDTGVRLLVVVERPARMKTVRRLLEEEQVGAWTALSAELEQHLGMLLGLQPDLGDPHAFLPLI
ncbi:MAG: replication-relaxation family protein [Patescibacteria group bacterium]|nr:replication-relaxation family protein [Patescibacteria group bacterium]